MSEKVTIIKETKINYNGNFDLSDLYRKLKWWLEYQGYGDELSNFKELRYTEKIKPEGKQVEIAWQATKEETDYIKFVIDITFFVVAMKDVEVESDGKKLKLNKADITLKFSASMIENYNDKFAENSFVNRIFKKFIIKENLEQAKIDLYQKTLSLVDEAKGYLSLQKG